MLFKKLLKCFLVPLLVHKDIRTDLESTRLPDVSQSTRKTIFKVPSTERKIARTKKDVDKAIASERKPVRSIKG